MKDRTFSACSSLNDKRKQKSYTDFQKVLEHDELQKSEFFLFETVKFVSQNQNKEESWSYVEKENQS